jgi:hypothetical protein
MRKSDKEQFFVHGDLETESHRQKQSGKLYYEHKCIHCGLEFCTWTRTIPTPVVSKHFSQIGKWTTWICRRRIRGTLHNSCLFRVARFSGRSQIEHLLLQEHQEIVARWSACDPSMRRTKDKIGAKLPAKFKTNSKRPPTILASAQ